MFRRIEVGDGLFVTELVMTAETLTEAAKGGFCSVLNLNASVTEPGFASEEELLRKSGMTYAQKTVTKDTLTDELTKEVLGVIDGLPRPALIHGASGIYAGALVST